MPGPAPQAAGVVAPRPEPTRTEPRQAERQGPAIRDCIAWMIFVITLWLGYANCPHWSALVQSLALLTIPQSCVPAQDNGEATCECARIIQAGDFSTTIRAFMGSNQTFVGPPNEYEVHAMSLFDGVLFFQVVNDIRFPAWVPSIVFEIVDGTMPNDWKCNLFSKNGEKGPSDVERPIPWCCSPVQFSGWLALAAHISNAFLP